MSYFRENIDKLAGYTPGFQPVGNDVVKLNTNENPYPPSPKVIEAMARIEPEQLRRYPSPLGAAFRDAAGEVLGVSPEEIICTNGGDDLLTICLRAFCDEDCPMAYPMQTYSLYPVLADLENCRSIEIPFGKNYELPVEALADSGASLVIVCNPNAPSGTVADLREMATLADKLKGKAILLIDEAYVDFAENNCLGLIAKNDNVIILRSMSKGYSLAGLRFGFGVACRDLISGLMKVKDSYNVDAVSIAAATAAMMDQPHFLGNVEKLKAERKRLTESLCKLGMVIGSSQTNFILAKCDSPSAADVYEQLAKRNIYVRYFNLPTLTDKLRITVGTAEQNNMLINALKTIIS